MVNSRIIHNATTQAGGGVYVAEQGTFNAANNLIVGNVATDVGATSGDGFGGGLGTTAFGSADAASISMAHSTIAFNQAMTAGGGFAFVNFSGNEASLEFRNNIFFFNDDLNIAADTLDDEFVNDGNDTNISFNNIQSSSTQPMAATGSPVLDDDPLFTPSLRLDNASPSVDAGSQQVTNTTVNGLSTRVDGASDVGVVDLGFHFESTPVTVNQAFNLNDSIVAPQGEAATLEFTAFTTNFCDVSTDPLPGRVVGVRLVAANSFPGALLRSLTTLDPLLVGGVMATDNGEGVYRVEVTADARPVSGSVQLEVYFDALSPPMLIEYFDVQLQ